jgi:RNA methyltransferase, TrmH family
LAAIKNITSRDNPVVKALRALAGDAREIRRQGRTLIDGPHLVAAYRQRRGAPRMLLVSESASSNSEIQGLLAELPEVDTLRLADGLFREISGVATPVGILAVIALPEPPTGVVEGSCVVLDAVQDAGNVGAILRTAAAAGIPEIVLGPGCAGVWTPRVLRAAQGAHFSLTIREQTDLVGMVKTYAGRSVATVARGGASLYSLDLAGEVAWIFGNEGTGVSGELVGSASCRATIPLATATESLNVAAAAAICLFEGVRQRLFREKQLDV